VAFAAPSIADHQAPAPVPTTRGPGRGPYWIIQRDHASQTRAIAVESSFQGCGHVVVARIIRLWRIGVSRTDEAMVSMTLRTLAIGAAVAIALGGRIPAGEASSPSKELVIEGRVVSIGMVNDDLNPWLITVKVEKVLTGRFSEPTFSFAIHSPAVSGLKKGEKYRIEAIWKDGGYTVDELQWRRRNNRLETCADALTPANMALQRTIALPRCARAGAHL
jgi:hypothetical protein